MMGRAAMLGLALRVALLAGTAGAQRALPTSAGAPARPVASARRPTVVTTGSIKWDFQPASWGGVFMGSNDALKVLRDLNVHLWALGQEQVELVSVVGGMYYLRILENARFHRVTLFDGNVNELAKAWRVAELLRASDSYAEFKRGYDAYAEDVDAHFGAHFLPSDLAGAGAAFEPHGVFTYHKQRDSPLAILGPRTWPKFQWRPAGAQQYNGTRENVREALSPRLFTPGVPSLDAGGRVVVVFLSHVPPLEGASWRAHVAEGPEPWRRAAESSLASRIRNASLILPVFAESWVTSEQKVRGGYSNRWVLEPHLWWNWAVLQEVGRTRPILQVWNEIDRKWKAAGSWADRALANATGTYADTYARRATALSRAWRGSVVLHILFGKSPTADRAAREATVRAVIETAAASGARKVIVTDYNRDAEEAFAKIPTALSSAELQKFVASAVGVPGTDAAHCAVGAVRHAPGDGKAMRNTIVRVDCPPPRAPRR